MKKILFIIFCFIAVFAGVSLSSCSSDKKNSVALEEIPQYTLEDTLRILKASEEFMDKLQENNVNSALDMLYKEHHDSIIPISAQERKDMVKQFKTMPVLSYEVDRLEMFSPVFATITFKYKFMENPTEDKNFPCTTKLTLTFSQFKGKAFLSPYEFAIIK